jgi:cholinesterase
MISSRRKTCEAYFSASLPVFSYRFDTPLWNAAVTDGAKRVVNVQFSMQNISGTLGLLLKYESYHTLSQNIGKAYISFVYDHDPNTSQGNSTLPYWPQHTRDEPQNMVLNSNRTYIKPDTFRSAGISFISGQGKLCSWHRLNRLLIISVM